ncbi:hypothetical protein QFC22_001356 [Naganishia vaughanmartiniae]|uniref:Uncharacterized protein n=1 Tax=Naganishia vaughanmartiniae TaxID=1424756 RepID=A0ACC2XH54_9TREE|nr:hypothetical protein QFC22_001356 [Naganishia vaughanmartiniae]
MSTSQQPVNLVSVNTAPERAKRLIGILIKDVSDKYTIVHAGNAERIEDVEPLLKSIQPPPGILFCASMWTPEQQEEIQRIARTTIPGIRTAAIPTGLQVERGPDAVVEFLKEKIDDVMAGRT